MTRRRHEPEPEPEPKYIKAGEELYRYIKSMMLFKLSSRLWRNIQKNRRPKFPISFLLLKLLRREHLWYRVGRSFRLGRAGTTSSIMINKWVTLHHLAEPGGPWEKDFQTLYDISIVEDDITIDINLPEHIRYAIIAGAVTGGGLTVIANAPNPAGQAILGKYFKEGISALQLFLWAALPTFIIFCLYNFIYFGD